MSSGFLRIAYQPTTGYGYSIINALRSSNAPSAGKLLAEWESSGAGKHLVSISTKLRIVDVVLDRLERSLDALKREVARQADLEELMKHNQGVITSDIVFDALTDIDAFFFELKSTSEILGHFVKAVGTRINGFPTSQPKLVELLEASGIPSAWAVLLAERRILHFHNSGIWLAYEVHSTDPLTVSEIVLESPTSEERLIKDGLKFSDLQTIRVGLIRSVAELERLIVRHIEDLKE